MRRLGVLAALLLVTGCGEESAPLSSEGDVPITERAVAAMALTHAPDDTTSRAATYTDRGERSRRGLGADLRYHGDGESDGDLLRVFVTPGGGTGDPCAAEQGADHCVSEQVAGGTLATSWDLEAPEEDPGYVAVTLVRPDETVSVLWAGDTITRDPRELELFLPVDTLVEIAEDPRISMTTSQAVVDAGAALGDWEGGEVGDRYDRVPSTDQGIGWGYWLAGGGWVRFHDLRPSPLKAAFGEGAIGARFDADRIGRDVPAQTVDVLAAPEGPPWLVEDVCASDRFAGHCVAEPARKGTRWFAWVPGPAGTGEVWAVQRRADEVVAFRYAGFDVPEAQRKAMERVEWWSVKGLLGNYRIGLMTDREVLEADL